MGTIMWGLFVSGLIFSAGPCLASCGPLLVSYIAGTQKGISQALGFYALFSLARISVYLVLSLAVFFIGGAALETLNSPWAASAGGIFILLVGAAMAFDRTSRLKLPMFLEKVFLRSDLKNPVVFGLVFGLLPCLPLVAILTYVGLVAKTWQQALVYTFSFGLGTFLSLLLLVSAAGSFISNMLKREKQRRLLRIISGTILAALGLHIVWRAVVNAQVLL